MTDDIAAFVRARLDEDEAAAQAATEGPWIAEVSGETGHCVIPSDAQSTREHVAKTQLYAAAFDADHIAAHDPARVLREVATWRAVVEELEQAEFTLSTTGPGTPPHDIMTGATNTLRRTMRHLAAIWSDHPKYKAEWRP